MATTPNAVSSLPAGFELDSSAPAPASSLPAGFEVDQPAQSDTPGVQTNDVGNAVIVPKPGESFADTMQRAARYGKTVTPDQVKVELQTAPSKAAEVVTAAPLMGATGSAALAAPSAIPSVLVHTADGVRAIGAWANANPVQAYLLYNVIRELLPGAKAAMGFIKKMPEVE